MIKNIIKGFIGLLLASWPTLQVTGAETNTPAFQIPECESNLVFKVVSCRKTQSIVNGVHVPIFTTDTNVLGRMDTGVLCCVVSPQQFAKTFIVFVRQPFEMEELWELTPSYKAFKLGNFYKLPYSIKDLGYGEGTNLYFRLGGGLRLYTGMNNHSNVVATSKLETAGDYVWLMGNRYYVTADEARAEVERLRPLVEKYEKQLEEIKAGLREERERRKKLEIETKGIYLDDETDKYSMLKKEIYKLSPLYRATQSELLNAEKQLQDFNKQTKGSGSDKQ
jgi:hypothetical protein